VNSRRRFLAALATARLLSSPRLLAEPETGSADELCVMTYNLRYASATPPNDWPTRRPAMKALIHKYAPSLIGTQEGLYPQLKDIAADAPHYEWLGLGRDGGSRGEFMAIFFLRDRFEPLEYDHFWLSDTPEVIASSTWGNTNRRMVTWVRFLDRNTRREFYFWNTHLDHALQPAREKGAALIRQRLEKTKSDLPLLLVGDFNAVATQNRAYDLLVKEGGLADTWFGARERRNPDVNSFNGFEPLKRDGQRIDWILARGMFEVRAAEVVTFSENGQVPSDHFPVVAWLKLPPRG
jgi:endonuclease/exonuclease/phosphatase family metal-dependent hydrolase